MMWGNGEAIDIQLKGARITVPGRSFPPPVHFAFGAMIAYFNGLGYWGFRTVCGRFKHAETLFETALNGGRYETADLGCVLAAVDRSFST
jgi:hypothetical protein